MSTLWFLRGVASKREGTKHGCRFQSQIWSQVLSLPKELMLLGNAPQSVTKRQGREVRRDSVTM